MIRLDELTPQEVIREQATEFCIKEVQEQQLDALNERLNKLQVRFEANRLHRKKDYGKRY